MSQVIEPLPLNQVFAIIVPTPTPGKYELHEIEGPFGTCEEALWFHQKGDYMNLNPAACGMVELDAVRLMLTDPKQAAVGRCLMKGGAVCWMKDRPQTRYYCHRRALAFIRRLVREICAFNPAFDRPQRNSA